MVEKSQEYLRLALAAAAILIGLSVAYHYVIYIPEKDREQQAQEQSKEQNVVQQQEAQQTAAKSAALARKANYEVCLANAQTDYSTRWDSTCKSRSDANEKSRAQCIANGSDEAFCLSSFPQLLTTDCELPGTISSSYDLMLKEDRQRCLDEAKADVTTP